MIITNIRDIQGENIDWVNSGKRFKEFRQSLNLTRLDVANDLHLTESVVAGFERAREKNRKSTSMIWDVSFQWDLSINWLLNGLGKPHDPDPVDLLPPTLFVQRGAGIRQSCIRGQAEEGNFDEYVSEFLVAMDKFKSRHNIPFPTLTQIYEIITALGYRKAVPARIAPLGYIVEHQLKAENLKQVNEKTEVEEFASEIRTPFSEMLPKPRPYRQGRFLCIDPKGKKHIVRNLTQFCREHQLSLDKINSIRKEKKEHNGWIISSIFKPFKLGKLTVLPIDKIPEYKPIEPKPIEPKPKIKPKPKPKIKRKFLCIDPEGKNYITSNMSAFCQKHNLKPNSMYGVIHGKYLQHKEWMAKEIKEP